MTRYQVLFTPIEGYFFGGEKSVKNNDKFEMDYFVTSELYPQQTTLLGALRFTLLKQAGLLGPYSDATRKEKAAQKVGNSSFSYSDTTPPQTFGIIEKISPLYFIKAAEKYLIAPKDDGMTLKKEGNQCVLEGYDPKEPPKKELISLDGKSCLSLFKDEERKDMPYFFVEEKVVGNKKGKEGKTEDDGFFKQTRYRLNDDCHFAIDVILTEEIANIEDFVVLGAEQLLSKITIKKVSDNKNTDFSDLQVAGLSRAYPALYLLSDAFLKEEVWQHTLFAVNEYTSFRNIKSSVTTQNYSGLNKDYHFSTRYNLMKRGSVLYFKDMTDLNTVKALLTQNKVGFNYFQII